MSAAFPRIALRSAVLEAARGGPALLVTGPPGAGKTTLLLDCAETLAAAGWHILYLDLMAAASSPERFVASALDALPRAVATARRAEVAEASRLARSGRASGAAAVGALFSLWASLDEVGGRPVALLLDEATEIRSLAYFDGLRRVDALFGAALLPRRSTILATSFPTLARRLWRSAPALAVPPLGEGEIDPALARASFGWPRHAAALLEATRDGRDLREAWTSEMALGGRLETGCRHTYETLLLRSRGYGICKAVLAAVAEEEGLNLTALVSRVGRTAGATRDYLIWLVGVDALRAAQKRYFYVDGLVRWWVRLHARGTPPRPAEIADAADQVLAGHEAAAGAPAAPEGARRESLIEID
ncbi:MAG TPA: ATP-binding protein [Vicinamibacteria bacterium]|nr:ATP-binding protein [Vicinamibacteria bacterium]